jgi:hypothetical protein
VDPGRVSVVQVRDTLHLDMIRVSAHLVERLEPPAGVSVETLHAGAARISFDAGGLLERLPKPQSES